jgi:hypothetical protein
LRGRGNGESPQVLAVLPVAGDLTVAAVGFADLRPLDEEVDMNESSPRLISTYATEQVIKNIPTSVERLRNLATALSNKAIEGYAVEEQLKKCLDRASNPGASLDVQINNTFVPFAVGTVVPCDARDLEYILKQRLLPDTWLFVAGRQGAFDAVHVVSDTRIRFVQATAGGSHAFYLDIIDALLRRFQRDFQISWTHVEFMVIRPLSDRNRPFALKTARGGLGQGYLCFDGQAWDRRDY